MNRFKAALVHFLISVIVFSLFLSLVFFIWYAYPFNVTQGVAEIVYMMAGVDIVLGPLLTLIVFNTAKKSLKFDLSVIGAFQLIALLYGGYIIYSERPAWVVFAKDRFEVVGLSEVDSQQLLDKSLDVGVLDKPRLVYAEPATGDEASDILFEAVSGGKDIDRRPKFYRSYSESSSSVVAGLSELHEHSEVQAAVTDTERLRWAPVKGKLKSIVALVDKNTGSIVDYLMIYPWSEKADNSQPAAIPAVPEPTISK